MSEGDDTAGFWPKLEVGRRLPHIELEVLTPGQDSTTMSLTDIGSQLRHSREIGNKSPRFTVIIVGLGDKGGISDFDEAIKSVSSTTGVPVDTVAIFSDQRADEQSLHDVCRNVTYSLDSRGNFESKLNFGGIILVRPDGHIASLLSSGGHSKRLEEELKVGIERAL